MSSYGNVEFLELVGLYLLLAYIEMMVEAVLKTQQDLTQNIKKIYIFKIFKSNGLSITVECNLIVTDFLVATFDLKSAT